MFDAISMGISVDDFWKMSARAVILMTREWIRRNEKSARNERKHEQRGRMSEEKAKLVRLDYIPRP